MQDQTLYSNFAKGDMVLGKTRGADVTVGNFMFMEFKRELGNKNDR